MLTGNSSKIFAQSGETANFLHVETPKKTVGEFLAIRKNYSRIYNKSKKMARKNKHDVKIDKDFGSRLKEAFDNKPNTEIARELEVSDSAVTLYLKGRIPSASTLIEISNLTNCSIHWLLTGIGERKIKNSKSKTHTLIFKSGKGGVGTTTVAMLSAVVLAARGFRTLLVSNPENIVPFLFSLNKNQRSTFPSQNRITTESDKFTSTSIENLEIFTAKGDEFVGYFDSQSESINKRRSQIKKEYQFIIFDICGDSNLLNNGEVRLKSFLSEAKLIIPYEVGNSTPETINKIFGSAILCSTLFSSSFLGLFINKANTKNSIFSRLYKVKKGRLEHLLNDKMFKTKINYNEEALFDFIRNSDLNKFRKTILFKDFSKLVDEILEKLKKY